MVYRRNRRHLRRTQETTGDSRSEMVLPPRPKPSCRDPPVKLPVPPAIPGTSESHESPSAAQVQKPPAKSSVLLRVTCKTSRILLHQLLQHEVDESLDPLHALRTTSLWDIAKNKWTTSVRHYQEKMGMTKYFFYFLYCLIRTGLWLRDSYLFALLFFIVHFFS